MSRLWRIALSVILLGTLVIVDSSASDPRQKQVALPLAVPEGDVAPSAGEPRLYFIENHGQIDGPVAYYVQDMDRAVYFTAEGITVLLTNPETIDIESKTVQGWVLKLDFVGANPNTQPIGLEQMPATVSYFVGSETGQKTGLKTYAKLLYTDLWPGVDLLCFSMAKEIGYQFTVHPGTDPNVIRLLWRGASEVVLNEAGQLEARAPLGEVVDDKPFAFQKINGVRVRVSASYHLEPVSEAGQMYSFEVGPYDPTEPLVIDPYMMVYCGYIGGDSWEDSVWQAHSIAVDSASNAYITGVTLSHEDSFPVVVGPYLSGWLGFIAKVNPEGTGLVYCGYLNAGPGIAIDVDSEGCAYVATSAGSYTATVIKVSADGTAIEYAITIPGIAEVGSVAVDSMGCAYITGRTSPYNNFPVTGAWPYLAPGSVISYDDVFVAKINADGTGLEYSGWLPGLCWDDGWDIDVDSLGRAYITGITNSDESTFPVTVGPDLTFDPHSLPPSEWFADGFVARVKADGSGLDYCGYLGSETYNAGLSIAVDAFGNAYIGTGQFIAKVNADGNGFDWIRTDLRGRVAIDKDANVYVLQPFAPLQGCAVAKIGPDGEGTEWVASLKPIGGTDTWIECHELAVDDQSCIYIMGVTRSDETSFPVFVGPDLTFNGEQDFYVAKFCPQRDNAPTVEAGGPYQVDEGSSVVIAASGNDPDDDTLTFFWDLDNNGDFETPGQTVTFSAQGLDGPVVCTIAVRATDPNGLSSTDEATVEVLNVAPQIKESITPQDPMQANTTVNMCVHFEDPGTLDSHTAVWDWGDGTFSQGEIALGGSWVVTGSHVYSNPGVYTVRLTITDKDSASVEVIFPYIVIYDASAGFVTGAGWINSPPGAYTPDPTLVGKANFGFVSRYQKGANIPTGATQFQFRVANLNFHSDRYDWLVVAGARAQYKGVGTINGTGQYAFLLTAIDAALTPGVDTDLFRIKIWDKTNGAVVYDNQLGVSYDADPATAIGGGSIIIHK